jgi:hypothetical protein
MALTEVDDLFGHDPVRARTRESLDAYARAALQAGRYDFHMGRKLAGHLAAARFTVVRQLTFADQELAFSGPARTDVLDAWRSRLDRMKLLHEFCGAEFAAVRDDFLACLGRTDHRSTASVCFCLARRTESDAGRREHGPRPSPEPNGP